MNCVFSTRNFPTPASNSNVCEICPSLSTQSSFTNLLYEPPISTSYTLPWLPFLLVIFLYFLGQQIIALSHCTVLPSWNALDSELGQLSCFISFFDSPIVQLTHLDLCLFGDYISSDREFSHRYQKFYPSEYYFISSAICLALYRNSSLENIYFHEWKASLCFLVFSEHNLSPCIEEWFNLELFECLCNFGHLLNYCVHVMSKLLSKYGGFSNFIYLK